MTSSMLHDTPLIPWGREASFIEGVVTDESCDLGVDELLVRAAASEAAAAAVPGRSAAVSASPTRPRCTGAWRLDASPNRSLEVSKR